MQVRRGLQECESGRGSLHGAEAMILFMGGFIAGMVFMWLFVRVMDYIEWNSK